METLNEWGTLIFDTLGPGVLIVMAIMAFIGAVGMFALFSKANQPGIASIVPIWNMVIFLRIIGRPWTHMFLFLVPIYNIYLTFKVFIELCQSFGKNSKIDYVLIILLNGLYILNLALSYDSKYHGPVFGNETDTVRAGAEPQLA